MTRRQALKTTALVTAAAAAVPGAMAQVPVPTPIIPFSLPPLPYGFNDLEPYIDARTMEVHYTKHHQAYVDNLNKAIAATPELTGKTIEALLTHLNSLPEKTRTAIRNHGGGHYNHSLFWQMLKKNSSLPSGAFGDDLTKTFGNLSDFKNQFSEIAVKIFGSGWAWLTHDGKGLIIETTPNQDTPLSAGHYPLLGLDVWEHAYYLKHENKRADYIGDWWSVVNWEFVTDRYAKMGS